MALRCSAKFTSFLNETRLRKWCGDNGGQLCIRSRWSVKQLRLTTLQALHLINQVCSPSLIRTMVSRRLRKPEIGSLFRNEDLSGSLNLFIFDKLCYSRDEPIGNYCHWIKPIRATLELRLSLKVPSRMTCQQFGGGGTFLGYSGGGGAGVHFVSRATVCEALAEQCICHPSSGCDGSASRFWGSRV